MRERVTIMAATGRGNAAGGSGETEALRLGVLANLVGYVLRRAQLSVFDDFMKTFEPLDLRPAQFSALILIDANPGRSQREIAAALGIQRPNFVAMMDEFERRGLAKRHRSEVDRRSHALELTDEGRALLSRAEAIVKVHEERVTERLSAVERTELLRLLARL
jgi:DNA-binding MarR family transcriptional regulator